jgi:predicted nucleic acid-binding protein
MYLIDTNIILELLLNQTRSDEVDKFLRTNPLENLYISDFSVYSIGILLLKQKLQDVFMQFIEDFLLDGGVQVKRLSLQDMVTIVNISKRFNLDFDDAYQYVTAEKYNLTIISFDKDFDRTIRRRKTPAEVLK